MQIVRLDEDETGGCQRCRNGDPERPNQFPYQRAGGRKHPTVCAKPVSPVLPLSTPPGLLRTGVDGSGRLVVFVPAVWERLAGGGAGFSPSPGARALCIRGSLRVNFRCADACVDFRAGWGRRYPQVSRREAVQEIGGEVQEGWRSGNLSGYFGAASIPLYDGDRQ